MRLLLKSVRPTIALMAALSIACTNERAQDPHAVRSEGLDCPASFGKLPPIVTVRDTTLASREQCLLISQAVALFVNSASADAEMFGPLAHQDLRAVRFWSLARVDSMGVVTGDWWVIEIELPRSTWNAEVVVDKADGQMSVRRAHKPM